MPELSISSTRNTDSIFCLVSSSILHGSDGSEITLWVPSRDASSPPVLDGPQDCVAVGTQHHPVALTRRGGDGHAVAVGFRLDALLAVVRVVGVAPAGGTRGHTRTLRQSAL